MSLNTAVDNVVSICKSDEEQLNDILDQLVMRGLFSTPDKPHFCGKFVITAHPGKDMIRISSHVEGSKFRLDVFAEITERLVDIKEPFLMTKGDVIRVLNYVAVKLKG